MKAPLSYAPMLPAAVGMAAGILLESHVAVWLVVAVCVVAFALLYAKERHYLSFFPLMTLVGCCLASSHRELPADPQFFDGNHVFYAEVSDISDTSTGLSMTAKITAVDSVNVDPITCILYLYGHKDGLADGSHIVFKSHLQDLYPPSVVPYAFDYSNYLRGQGINYMANASASQVNIAQGPGALQRLVNDVRDDIYDAIVQSPVTPQCSAFLLASILGDRDYITQQDKDAYRTTGVSHMLALSGLHMGVLASLLMIVLLPLHMVRRGYVVRCVLVIALVWAYAIIVGMPDSVMRAAVMITVLMLSLIIQHGYFPVNSLCVAFVVVLAARPLSLTTPGFQMSFAAVAALLAANSLVPREALRHWWYRIAAFVCLPIAAMLGTGIVAAYYYNMFPGMFLLANMVVGLLFPVLLSCGYVLTIFSWLGFDFHLLGWFVSGVYSLMAWAIDGLAQWRVFAIDTYFNAWTILPYYLTLALVVVAIWQRSRRWAAYAACMAAITVLVGFFGDDSPQSELYMPSETADGIILHTGHTAYLVPFSDTDPGLSDSYADRYATFLRQRGCGDTFKVVTDSMADGPFAYRAGILIAGDRTIAIVDDEACQAGTLLPRCDYAIIPQSFTLHINQVIEAVNPDTILISRAVAPSRAGRLIREATDLVPIYKLRAHPVAITHP